MRRSMLQRMLLVAVSIGWWGGFGVTESQGQTCRNNYVCTASPNTVSQNYATVGGGSSNTASGIDATVGGGSSNTASEFATTIGGGYSNTASESRATVGGGSSNTASGIDATVGGGFSNEASGDRATVGGGYQNTAQGDRATVSGGTRIFSNAAATVGVRLAPGSNAWSIASDRALKKDFQDIDKQQVLANVQHLTIQNWKLKDEAGNVRHVGPVAQDFHAAFGLGGDERFIHTGDAVGVSLVAIQALAEQSEALAEQNQALEQHVEALQQQLSQVVQQVHILVHERHSAYRQEAALAEERD